MYVDVDVSVRLRLRPVADLMIVLNSYCVSVLYIVRVFAYFQHLPRTSPTRTVNWISMAEHTPGVKILNTRWGLFACVCLHYISSWFHTSQSAAIQLGKELYTCHVYNIPPEFLHFIPYLFLQIRVNIIEWLSRDQFPCTSQFSKKRDGWY